MNGPRGSKLMIVTACLVAVAVLPSVSSAAIRIAKIRYNPPGGDSGSNRHLNHEFIVIRNTGQRRATLTGWTIVERRGDVFTFPGFHLASGDKVTIHSGTGDDGRHHLFWSNGTYVWHNFSDKATLRDDDDGRVDRCAYVDDGETKQWLGHSADC